MSPSNEARYRALMEGLEATEVLFSELERTTRIDAEYSMRRYVATVGRLNGLKTVPLVDVVSVSDGNHFAISDSFCEDGVPYYRGQDVTGHFFVEQSTPAFITRQAFDMPSMRRSHLRRGDVLLSIVGTIGELSLVKTDRPATCSCKLAILRPTSISPNYLSAYLSGQYGRSQIHRLTRGAVQMGLLLEDMDQVRVARLGTDTEQLVSALVEAAYDRLHAAERLHASAERVILEELGLADWQPPEPLTYVRRASDAQAAGRLDAEYFRPRYDAVRQAVCSRFPAEPVGAWGKVLKGWSVEYTEEDTGTPIIRSGDLADIDRDDGYKRAAAGQEVFCLRPGDVCISSIGFGSIGKVQVFDRPGVFGTVSEVTVVRQQRVNPYYLRNFLRSRFGQIQIEQRITGATGQLHLYPKDVASILVPIPPSGAQGLFEHMHREAVSNKEESAALLARAKRAVEIAIEEDESAALRFLGV